MKSLFIGGLGLVIGAALTFSYLSDDGAQSADQGAQMSMAGMDMPIMDTSDMDMSGDMSMDSEAMAHDHPLREVAVGTPVPTVTHLVFPDAMDGYNIQILTSNFTFTPAGINRAVVEGEGHAHLYVNGSKVSRIYGSWIHLPSAALAAGVNVVSVTLNANDHSEWAQDGVAIASSVQVIKAE